MRVEYAGTTQGGRKQREPARFTSAGTQANSSQHLFWGSTSKHKEQAPFQKPAPINQSVFPPSLFALQHPLRR
jgi:hypothetical protein